MVKPQLVNCWRKATWVYVFGDSDQEIERVSGQVLAGFLKRGWRFRQRETRVLDKPTQLDHVVLATGSGAVTIAENHHFLKRGIIIYLRAEVDIQYDATCRDRKPTVITKIDNP